MALPFSCQQPSDLPPSLEVIDPSISIEEAKVWFEENYGTAAPASNARIEKKDNKTPLWDLAKESKFKKGHPIVVIPLAYEGEASKLTAALDGTDNPAPEPWESEHTLIRKLIVFKNKKAEKQAVVMYVIPTKQYKLANPKGVKGENFTGVIVFKDYNEENLLEAWRMENGEVIGLQIPSKNGNPKKGGRMAYWCVTVKYGYYDCPSGANPDGTTKLGGAQRRESAIMEDCNFVVTSTEQQCFDSYSSGSGTGGEANGGYFDYQVPSGGGGSGDGLGEAAYASDYNHWYVEQFILEYGQRLNLRTEEIVYFMDHPSIIESVKEFLALFGDWAFRAESFIEDQISKAMDWVSMHPNERNVLRSKGWSLYNINLISYAMSAIWAQKNTNEKFPQNQYPDVWMINNNTNCGECRANAFKHAILAVYLSHMFNSSSFAKQLQDAHEEWAASTPASQMDLDNNKEGYKVYDGNGYLHNKKLFYVYNNYQTTASIYQTLVMDKFNNGELVYLKDLGNNVKIRKSTNQL